MDNRSNAEAFVKKHLEDPARAPVFDGTVEHPMRYSHTGKQKPVEDLTDEELRRLVFECEKFMPRDEA